MSTIAYDLNKDTIDAILNTIPYNKDIVIALRDNNSLLTILKEINYTNIICVQDSVSVKILSEDEAPDTIRTMQLSELEENVSNLDIGAVFIDNSVWPSYSDEYHKLLHSIRRTSEDTESILIVEVFVTDKSFKLLRKLLPENNTCLKLNDTISNVQHSNNITLQEYIKHKLLTKGVSYTKSPLYYVKRYYAKYPDVDVTSVTFYDIYKYQLADL